MTGLDKVNEQAVVQSLDRLDYGCTTFLITHDLSHAAKADLILYLEGGRIAELGSHDQLLQANGGYANLYRLRVNSMDPVRDDLVPVLAGVA